jgi:long-subunit fatty acid transport protein
MVATHAHAQGGVRTLEFSFSNPGARSLGLGGAFAALADDATAAFANPGGLVQLTRPEISFELRAKADLTPGGLIEDEFAAVSGVGFLSFVYPRGDWSVAVYAHQLANIESVFRSRIFLGEATGSLGSETSSEVTIGTLGLSGAYRLTESLSLGLGVVHFDGQLESRTDFFYPSTPTLAPDTTIVSETVSLNDSDWGVRAGFLWHISEKWNLGGFYRQAPRFEAKAEQFSRSATVRVSEEAVRYPDAFGVGIAFKSGGGALAASAEWEHVDYSATTTSSFGGIERNDGDEFHMGIEYVFLGITPIIALRGGAWFDPEPEIRALSDGPRPLELSLGGSVWHVAFGTGFAFRRVQIDLGLDVSEVVVTVSLSGVVNF